jgi:hypothetical protein
MATNPRIPDAFKPDQQRGPGLHPKRPKSGVGGVVLALIVAALLITAVIYFMPRSPKATPPATGATVPAQPTGNQVQITNLTMASGPTDKAVSLQGVINNHGQTTINGLAVQATFRGENGTVAGQENAKVLGLKQEGQTFVSDDLTKVPIKPNDSRPFRVTFDNVPQGWDHSMPGLRIVTVTGTGQAQ